MYIEVYWAKWNNLIWVAFLVRHSYSLLNRANMTHFPTELKQCRKFLQRSDIRFLKAKMV